MIGFNLDKAKRQFTKALAEHYSQREAEQLMRILLEDFFGLDRKSQLMNPDFRIDEVEYAILKNAVEQLLEDVPVQYVTRKAWFDGLLFYVDKSVLIPRPETEGLVQLVGSELSSDKPVRIWDIGTGSGCIAIALSKRFPQAQVTAFDVSEKALNAAKMNVIINEVQVELVCDDVLHPQSEAWQQPVDIVVSNPPYIRESEKAAMERNVLDHEPALALFVPDDDPLLFYRQILSLAKPQLAPGGSVWFEINEAMGEEMVQLCHVMGFEGEILLDFFGKPRFLHIFAIKGMGVDENSATALKVYPNPAKEQIRIEGLEANSEVELFNELGMLVRTINTDQDVDISNLPAGVYVIRYGARMVRFVKE